METAHDDSAPLLDSCSTKAAVRETDTDPRSNTQGYDLDSIDIPDAEVDRNKELSTQKKRKVERKRANEDDFVYFHPLKKWQDPSPWPSLTEVASSSSFDPFGVDFDSADKSLPIAPAETEDFFMPDPMVDPSGVTVDSFYLNGFEDNTGVEFYPNRAVKLYYQASSLPADGIPESFLCPIGLEIMADPVILPDGHSYDRSALMKWMKVNNTSPATRQVVSLDDIRPNWMLRNLIRQYKKKQGLVERRKSYNCKVERRRQRRMPIPFADDGISRLAI